MLLGLLCSYDNVGVANVSLDHVSHQVDLQWRKKSSQMCVMPFAGDGASGVLSIRVASRDHGRGSNQVKLMAVIQQRSSSL